MSETFRTPSRSPSYTSSILPLTAETEGIFNARTFAMMPEGAPQEDPNEPYPGMGSALILTLMAIFASIFF